MTAVFKKWLPFGVVSVAFAGILYIVAQQDLRTSANDPQIQIAEDLAVRLERGESFEFLNAEKKVDIAQSLAPFVSLYDAGGKMLVSTAELDGGAPVVPHGVLEYARTHGKHFVTWQPQVGVRSALVIVPYEGAHSGYVVAGRSLREVEKRVEQLTLQIILGILGMLVITFVVQKALRA